MPIPVPVTPSALPIDSVLTARAEAVVAALARILKYGTSGGSPETPPTYEQLLVNPQMDGSGNPILPTVDLTTADKQLFYRQLALAFAASLSGSFDQTSYTASINLVVGDAVYISGANAVSRGSCSASATSGIIGICAISATATRSTHIVQMGTAYGVLGGSGVAGSPYYLSAAGRPVLYGALTTGQLIVRLGYARNTQDLEVQIRTDLGTV